MRFWGMVLGHVIKGLAYDWIFAIGRLVSRFWKGVKALCKTRHLPHPERTVS